MILILILSCLINHDRHSKKCLSRFVNLFVSEVISCMSKKGSSLSDSPTDIALMSLSLNMSLIISLIRPPLYKKTANPSANTFIAVDEKKPSFRSNCVELHNASEKKPIGSHSVFDLKRLLCGHDTLLFNIAIFFYIKQFVHIISSPNMSTRFVPCCCLRACS